MDFKQIKTFLTVVDTGNITRAADILHIVQPAVSRQIKLLEEDLGTSLFDRQRHGMVLTESGKLLVNYASRAVLELDRARAAITGAQQGIGGLVTLGLLPSTIDALSGPLLTALARDYPGYSCAWLWVTQAPCYAGLKAAKLMRPCSTAQKDRQKFNANP